MGEGHGEEVGDEEEGDGGDAGDGSGLEGGEFSLFLFAMVLCLC